MAEPNGNPPFSAAKPVRGRHQGRFERCIHCDVPTAHFPRVPGCFPPDDYDWCPRCGMAMWCACEGCEIMRALAAL